MISSWKLAKPSRPTIAILGVLLFTWIFSHFATFYVNFQPGKGRFQIAIQPGEFLITRLYQKPPQASRIIEADCLKREPGPVGETLIGSLYLHRTDTGFNFWLPFWLVGLGIIVAIEMPRFFIRKRNAS